MGRKSWATDEQKDWLTEHIPEFVKAQGKDGATHFHISTYQAFLEKWPLQPPTAEEVSEAGGDVVQATVDKLQKFKDRIYWWFRNRTRAGSSTQKINQRSILNLTKKKNYRLHPYQIYLKLYKDKVMPIIKARYDQYRKSLPEGEVPKEEFGFRNELAVELLKSETEEVRAAVEAYRQKQEDLKTEEPEGADGQLDDLARKAAELETAIERLPRTVQTALEAIEQQTGWKGSVFLGGIHPTHGCLMTLMIHSGKTIECGELWPEAAEDWDATKDSFDNHIRKCFPEDACTKYDTGTKSRATSKAPNIGTPTAITTASNPSKRSRRTAAAASSLKRTVASLSPPPEQSASRETEDMRPAPDTTTFSGVSSPSNPTSPTPDLMPAPTPATAPALTSDGTLTPDTVPVPTPPPSALDPAPAPTTPQSTPPSTLDPAPAPTTPQSTPPSNLDPAPASTTPQSSPTDHPTIAPIRTSNGTALETESSVSDPTPTSDLAPKSASDSPTNDSPAWIKAASVYLQGVSDNTTWAKLVENWMEFEKNLGFCDGQGKQNRLPTSRDRPEEVKWWINRGRKYVPTGLPTIKTVGQYAATWKKWWMALQPPMHVGDTLQFWPPRRNEPNNASEWDGLMRGGPNGFFVIVVSLAWWIDAAKNDTTQTQLVAEVILDVEWVLNRLCEVSRSTFRGTKRSTPSDDQSLSEKSSPSKKQKL
ncbi:hypothetical protein A0H81_06612 [Grifola frondosa]|uniref:Uncharacterized protein n=1 Tax=Grifola frondosa TaxID=5627 RepID=A0A1C7M9N7_GRIFR|nr:hypothetical protein A0H81_06612 [Grifola frondosa]